MNLPEERTVYLEKDNISVNTTSNNPAEVEYLTALQRFNKKRDNYFSMKPIEQTRAEIAQNAVREQQNSLLGQMPRGAAGAAVSGVQTLGRLGVGAIMQAINDTRYAWEQTKLTDKYTWGSVNIKRENYKTDEEYETAKAKYYNDLNAQSRQLEAMHQNVDTFAREQMQEMKERHENWLRHTGLAKEETDGFLYDLSAGGVSLLMALGTAAITKSPAATAAVFGAIQGRQSYEEALANGVSPEKAEKIGLGAGAAEAILEKVGLDCFLRGLKARSWGTKLVRNFLTESIQEGSQGAANEIIMQNWGGKEASIRQTLEEVAYQALLGGLTGAGATGAHIGVEAAVRRILPQTAAAAQGVSTQEGDKIPPPTLEQVQELVRANEGRELTLQERYGVILSNGQAKLEVLGVPKETAQKMLGGIILKAGSRESLEDVQQMLNDENNPATYKNGDILESAKEFAEAVRGTQKQLTPEYQKQVYDIRDDVRERALEVGYTEDEAEAAANLHEAFAQLAYQVSGETPRAWYERNQIKFKDRRTHQEDTSFDFGNNVDYDLDRDGLPDDGQVLFQAAAMYQNKANSLMEFVDFYQNNKDNPKEQNKSFYRLQTKSGATVDVPFNRVKHIDNRHHLTPAQWAALEANIDNIEYAYYVPGQKGENNGVQVFIKANTKEGKAGAMLEVLPNGRVLLDTAFFDSDANIDNWAKNEPLQRPSSKKPVLVGNGIDSITDIVRSVKAQQQGPDVLYQTGYPGSAADFADFDLSKIGNGHGGKAHGWGLYFAKNKKTGEVYRKVLSSGGLYEYDGTVYGHGTPEDKVLQRFAYITRHFEEFTIPPEMEKLGKFEAAKGLLVESVADDYPFSYSKEEKQHMLAFAKSLEEAKIKEAKGQLYKVDIPENDVLLDENKSIKRQGKKVQDAIKELEEKENLKSTYDGKPIDTDAAEALSSTDPKEREYAAKKWREELAQTEKRHDTKKVKELKKLLQIFENFDPSLLNYRGYYFDNRMPGKEFYAQLSQALGSDRAASQALNKYGIKGIAYEDDLDGRCYVIFDDKSIKVLDTFYQQREGAGGKEQEPLGQTEFTDAGAVITLLEGANKTTLLHELGHVFLRDFERLAAENDNAATRHYTQVIESFLGKKEGTRWSREQQEKFARTFLEYVRTKDVPEAPQMRTVYDRFKDWLQEIYEAIDGTLFFEKNVSQEAKDFFNEVLAPQAVQVPDAAKFKGKIRQIRQAVEDIKHNRLPRAETGLALDDIKALYNQTKRRIPKAPQTDLLRELRRRGVNYKQAGRIDAEAYRNARVPNKPDGLGDDPARWLQDNGYMGKSYGETYEAQDALNQQAYDLIQAALDGKKVYRLEDQTASTQREHYREELEIIKEVSDNLEGAQEVLRKINEIERKGYRVLDRDDVRLLEEKLKATEKLADTEIDKLTDLKKDIVDEIKKRVDADQLEAYLARISAAKNKEALEAAVRRTMLAIEKAYVNRTLQMLNLLQNPRTKATLKEIQTAWQAPDADEQRAEQILAKKDGVVKNYLKDAFVSISDRLRRVDKQLARKIEDLPRKRVMRNSRYRQYFGDYITYIYKYVAKNPEDFELLSWAQMNRNDRAEAEIAAKYKDVKLNGKNLAQLIEEKNDGLKKIWEEGVNHGLSIGWLEAYNPRRMANTDAFIEFLQGTSEWSNIDRILKIMGVENGTTAEKAMAINKYFRGFEPKDLAAAQPRNIKQRDIMYVSKALSKFYKNSYEALMDYADDMAKAISIKEVFGVGEENLDDSVGKLVLEAKQRYRLSYREEKLLKDAITTFVRPAKASQVVRGIKTFSYLTTITNPISTISQLEDIGFTFAQWGHGNTLRAYANARKNGGWIKLEQIGAEVYDVDMRKEREGVMDKALRKLLGVNGFTSMDRLGKETYINADFQARQQQAQKSPQKLQKELEGLFMPKEAAEVVEALKNGDINNDNLQSLLYYDLSAVQPMSLLDMPERYALGGGGYKLLYQLKSFAARRANYLYTRTQEQFHEAQTPEEYAKAIADSMRFFTLLIGYGALTNLLKDFLLGRSLDVTEELVDTILQNAMVTRYMIKRGKQDPMNALINAVVPPALGTANDLWQDTGRVISGKKDISQMNIWSRLPIFGKPYYWWFGGGKAITEKDNKEKGLFKIKGWAGK